jgi:hypothetical protein
MNGDRFYHNTIAILYDFDGTLTPLPMQEYTILPEIGIKDGKDFWKEVAEESKQYSGEGIVTYMRLMIEKSKARKFPVRREILNELAQKIEYFKGVVEYFDLINKHVQENYKDVELRHYVVSAGLKEIIEGSQIAKHFYKIFASEYYYDENGAAVFPNVIVNDTLKTQFIFRINKGKEDLHENINQYMPKEKRPIPFQNILYLGDGLTDVPCMTVIRKNGGYAIAVYNPKESAGLEQCKQLLDAQRVDFIAEADYTGGTELVDLIKLLLGNIHEGIKYGRASFRQINQYFKKE